MRCQPQPARRRPPLHVRPTADYAHLGGISSTTLSTPSLYSAAPSSGKLRGASLPASMSRSVASICSARAVQQPPRQRVNATPLCGNPGMKRSLTMSRWHGSRLGSTWPAERRSLPGTPPSNALDSGGVSALALRAPPAAAVPCAAVAVPYTHTHVRHARHQRTRTRAAGQYCTCRIGWGQLPC